VFQPSFGQGLKTRRYEAGTIAYSYGLWEYTGNAKKAEAFCCLQA
jgi:hypothetical protein